MLDPKKKKKKLMLEFVPFEEMTSLYQEKVFLPGYDSMSNET